MEIVKERDHELSVIFGCGLVLMLALINEGLIGRETVA